jgi:hypothetical protein
MARDSSILGGADALLGAPVSVTGGNARPKVGRETSPYVPRQPQPLPEDTPKAEAVVTVGEPQFFAPPARESGEGAPSGGGPEGGNAGAPGDPGNAGDDGDGDAGSSGDTGVGGESGSGIGGDAW